MGQRYRCPVCGTVAEIDLEKRVLIMEPVSPKIPKPERGVKQVAYAFPSHGDCEFNKPVDEIEIENLIEVDHMFIYETYRGVPG